MSEVELYRESGRPRAVELAVTKNSRSATAPAGGETGALVPAVVLPVTVQADTPALAEIAPKGRNVTHGGVTLAGIGEKSLGAEPEMEAIRSKWRITQEELEAQKRERASEVARIAARLQLLEEQLSDAAREAKEASRASGRNVSHRAIIGIIAAVGFIGLAAIGLVVASRWPRPAPVTTEPPAKAAVVEQPVRPLPSDPETALSTAIDRLNQAIGGSHGRNPEEALRMVSKPGQGCRIIWVGTSPAVVFGQRPIKKNSLAETLADCAAAVARLR